MEIEQTRADLGKTVEALVAKADVKARAREKVSEVSGRLPERAGHLREQATSQAAKATATVRQAAPEPMQRTAERAAAVTWQRRAPVAAIVAAVAVTGWLLLRRRKR